MLRNAAITVIAAAAVVATRLLTIGLLCPPGSPGRLMIDSFYDWQESIGTAFGFPKLFAAFGTYCYQSAVALLPYALGGVGVAMFLGTILAQRFGRPVGAAVAWYALWHTLMLCAASIWLTLALVSAGKTQTFPEQGWADQLVAAVIQYGMMALPMVWALMFQHVRAALSAHSGDVEAYLDTQPGWLAYQFAGLELVAVGLGGEASSSAGAEEPRLGPFVVQ